MKDKEILNLPAAGSFTVDPAGDYILIAVPVNCEVSNER